MIHLFFLKTHGNSHNTFFFFFKFSAQSSFKVTSTSMTLISFSHWDSNLYGTMDWDIISWFNSLLLSSAYFNFRSYSFILSVPSSYFNPYFSVLIELLKSSTRHNYWTRLFCNFVIEKRKATIHFWCDDVLLLEFWFKHT